VSQAPFSEEEYRDRVKAVQARLREREFDGIVVSDPANLFYLTGYNAWSFYMPQFMYVPVDDDPVLLMREMDARGAHRTARVFTDRIYGYPESYIHQNDCHPADWLAQQLRELGFAAKKMRVAYEEDAHFFSVRTFLSLQAALPEWDLVPGRELVNWVRVVKSDSEIELMRNAAKITDAAMHTAIENIRAGRPLNEVAAEVQRAQTRGVTDVQSGTLIDGDYPAIVPMFPRGEGADTPHLTWTSEPIGQPEGVSIELAGVYQRYHAPLARTVSVGKPSADLDRVAKVTLEGFDAALEQLRPGNTPADVAAAWNRVLAANNLEKSSRLGYSIGVGFPPDWGEHTVSLRSDDHTELKPNMTFHMIAGMWMTGFGFECSESVRVADGGAELFTSVPRALAVKEA
jgi:ectoine hydrolase